ncbi:MAG: transcription antitermination factor NusB [Deltaproteobacteria bacterium]|nr:transcription antitermination factor NusB [Deltaproteobacteria bacterium]
MGSRRLARGYALQALYMADLSGGSIGDALSAVWSSSDLLGEDPPGSEEIEFAQGLAFGVIERRDEIDGLIEGSSTNWRLVRMPAVDRNVLRLAVYELIALEDIPGTVVINEAIELAKRFGTAESRAFVNGIVDRIARNLDRVAPRGGKSRRKGR